MLAAAIVFLGAGIGGVLRHGVNVGSARLLGPAYPWGTLIVNVTGSAAMGVLIGCLVARGGAGGQLRLFLATGVLGGYTTFSAFALDAVLLVERGEVAAAAGYIGSSVALSLIGLAAGLALLRALA